MRRSSAFVCTLGALLATAGVASAARPPLTHLAPRANTCLVSSISCNQTVAGTLTTADCSETLTNGDTFYEDQYQFAATAGEHVAVSQSSNAFNPFVFLANAATGEVVAQDDNGTATNSQLAYTIPTAGNYIIVASTLGRQQTGPYSVSLVCSTTNASTCVPDATTLCLNNGRFRVTAVWQTSQGSGTAQEVKLTDDTGYLWFFNEVNVEVVLKVLDGCPVNHHYWFFAGGLTNVYTQIRVVDTTTGFTRLYTNPLDSAFLPIQDTGAFATCP